MKNYFLGIFLPFIVVFSLMKQHNVYQINSRNENLITTDVANKVDTTIKDTLGYINSILSNKQKYINQPFSLFLNDLKINIASYKCVPNQNKTITSMTISFLSPSQTSVSLHSINKPVLVNVQWAQPVSRDSVSAILTKSQTKGVWGQDESRYYGKQIIKNLN